MEQPIEEKEIESDRMANELRSEPEEIEHITDKHLVNMIKGSEEITLKFNGVEISLSSSRVSVDVLCSIVLQMYNDLKLNGQVGQGGNTSYV